MRIATWPVDGINARKYYLCRWLKNRKPDIVALAEDPRMPEAVSAAGPSTARVTESPRYEDFLGTSASPC